MGVSAPGKPFCAFSSATWTVRSLSFWWNSFFATVENIRQICQNIAKYPSNFPKFQSKFRTALRHAHKVRIRLLGATA